MSIPKIIHCCWFGNKEMPADQQENIKHWKELMPDFEIKLWKDDDFKEYLGNSAFVAECIKQNKPGFLSDYFRFTVLYKFGGIYIDTDVEMYKSYEEFTKYSMFMGFFIDSELGTAVIGASKENPIIKELLDKLLSDFDKNHQLVVSNYWVTKYFIEKFPEFRCCGVDQIIGDNIRILPKDYLERYCLNPKKGGGYSEHHCFGSWYDRKENKPKEILKKILGRKIISWLGHKRILRKSKFYAVYKKDLKRK